MIGMFAGCGWVVEWFTNEDDGGKGVALDYTHDYDYEDC